MKRLLIVATALILGVCFIGFTSCGSHNGTIVYPNSMTATIGNVLSFTASGSDITAVNTNGTLYIVAKASNNSKIALTFPAYQHNATTFEINSIGIPVGATYDSLNNGNLLTASRGTITFTTVYPYLQGTYSFVCSDSTTVANGVFKIKAP